ncbi:Gins complex like protein [Nitzschia inconspicua]|uniref:Gins complex like protein n=1 Tax=Nitzschia inconspicua TaxID=303405 RepID=A0A9K3LJB8_9STRA|nr:Gins complex like protein [Nitzschia inconspicua]
MTSYYDIDAILAEEELIPCQTNFEFNLLASLDPDGVHHHHHHHHRKQQSERNGKKYEDDSDYLPENSRIKIPLWVAKRWAMTNFVRLQVPRHYGRKARERYDADPGDADLRKRNERFFLAGRMLVDLIERSSTQVAKEISSMRRNARRQAHAQYLKQVSEEARDLRRTLVKTYAGERLRKVFDWSMSSGAGDDDVSQYLSKLTFMEQRLYYAGASAAMALEEWKLFGNRRLLMGPTRTVQTPMPKQSEEQEDGISRKRHVTPGEQEGRPLGQRQRVR